MSKNYIIFFPFRGINAYIDNMKRCWGAQYKVISLEAAENNLYILLRTKAIVLNWIEGNLDKGKKKQLIFFKLLGIKIIWVFHNRIPHNLVGNMSKIMLAKSNMRFMASISNAIILHSINSKIYLQGYIKRQNKLFYIPHVDYDRQYRWSHGDIGTGDSEYFKFVFQGHIEPYKNVELIIQAFKELNLPMSQLCIVGRPYNEEYAQKIERISIGANIQIKFGWLSEGEVGEEIRKGDVVVLPYDVRSSMNSGSMMTAFSNKRTVIISCNAMAQDYKNKDFLYIYDYTCAKDHLENLKATMQRAYKDGKKHSREMGENAYEYTRKHNCDYAVIKQIAKMMEGI